jgi:hypothetical protein
MCESTIFAVSITTTSPAAPTAALIGAGDIEALGVIPTDRLVRDAAEDMTETLIGRLVRRPAPSLQAARASIGSATSARREGRIIEMWDTTSSFL